MARKVFKYTITVTDGPQQLHIPVGASLVHVGSKTDGFIDIWVVVDESSLDNTASRTFQVFGTGHPIPEDAQYCGTSIQGGNVSLHNGTFVWHLFERLVD